MRVLVHLSDIHFGRVNAEVVQPLIAAVWEHGPQVVVVSGDLTQRARTSEFKQARAFLDALPKPQIVVPGNHDIPLHNVFRRFYRPLKKYRRYITEDLSPVYSVLRGGRKSSVARGNGLTRVASAGVVGIRSP